MVAVVTTLAQAQGLQEGAADSGKKLLLDRLEKILEDLN